ncbi:MAG: hypothetical protein MR775_05735 [Erysipelotrichaceae bacterium]|nr:hypothetical protein [Erysipelotrichaceae bacterium]
MKKITKTLLCLSSVCLLAGCAREVTADEAKAAIKKANEKTPDISTVYTGVKLTFKVETLQGTGTFGEAMKASAEKMYGVEGTETSVEYTFATSASEIAEYRMDEGSIDYMVSNVEGKNDSYVKFYLDGDALSIKSSIAASRSTGTTTLTMYTDVEYKINADMTLASMSSRMYFNAESESLDFKYVISAEWMK